MRQQSNSISPHSAQQRNCPVCGNPQASASLFLRERIDQGKLSDLSFASRKAPEFMRHRLLHCPQCDVVFAATPPNDHTLAHAYHAAAFDSCEEADDAARTYDGAIAPVLTQIGQLNAMLEIGTGTGIFLEYMEKRGFASVQGVEPSLAAINAAPPHRRAWIKEGMFRATDYPPAGFDLICCFMTMEHVSDPKGLTESVYDLLRPGGVFAVVTHDYRHAVNRVLSTRSPIIDIEHLQLFSKRSIRFLLESSGFHGVRCDAFANRYSILYWVKLTPLPTPIKNALSSILRLCGISGRKAKINVGNLVSFGFK